MLDLRGLPPPRHFNVCSLGTLCYVPKAMVPSVPFLILQTRSMVDWREGGELTTSEWLVLRVKLMES